MASVFTDDYNIDYSVVTGKILSFEEWSEDNQEYIEVTEEKESKLIKFVNYIASQQGGERGYSAFLCKLHDEHKIELPT